MLLPPRLRLGILLMLPLLSACVHTSFREDAPLAAVEQLERAPTRDPADLKDADVLALGADARRFIDRQTAGIRDRYEKLRALRRAVFARDGLDFRFDNDLTLTAGETFVRARGNCLSLANFFVAAVRYLGMDATYQEVHRRNAGTGGADSYGGLHVIERHINVSGDITWGTRRARYVLDYIAVPEEDFARARIISDRRALAHYYNNLAIRHLAAGKVETALQYLKKAVLADPGVPFVWSNLGVAYTHRGDLKAAVFAYQRALALNRGQPSALHNLAALRARMQLKTGGKAGMRSDPSG
ncbi:MAG: tetratricopeptide repeat protein [Gammaproteobacteria bacterium]|jgi:tetratricopeptide (TPR) repeat protein